MNRRQFLDTLVSGATASGIVLAVPRVILAEDKKEEEKPAMYAYPWDDIYNDKDRVVPGAKKIVSKDKFTLDSFAQGYSLFKDPKKMEKLFPKLMDDEIKNEELGSLLFWGNALGFRILTLDTKITNITGTNPSEIKKYGPHSVYAVVENMSQDKLKKLAQYLNISLD